ncbi:hypothetical protein [Candidatus Ichthyocystis sparus]|uniref:hypothetical protein n=1 Tax=Candidatus Ichthyocystis sparus TaxID=1561004 RepID=UPI000B843B95|nr:hypothetical protein [Candidatus Ichthyocystis sparus]
MLGADPNDLIVAGDTDVDDDHVVLDQQVEFVLVWLISFIAVVSISSIIRFLISDNDSPDFYVAGSSTIWAVSFVLIVLCLLYSAL